MRVGDIYLVENGDIYPPKKKFSICVCVSEGYFLLINSENRAMYKCTPILKADHSFLSYDSFIGCSRFFRYTTEQLEGTARIKGAFGNDFVLCGTGQGFDLAVHR